MDSPNPNSSWNDLARRAAAERPQPGIDVTFSVRRRIEAETAAAENPRETPNLLDEIASVTRGLWGAAAAAVILLLWQLAPAVRELALAIELQTQLFAGL